MVNALKKFTVVDVQNGNRVTGVLDEEEAKKQANSLNEKLNESKDIGAEPKVRFVVKEHLVEG